MGLGIPPWRGASALPRRNAAESAACCRSATGWPRGGGKASMPSEWQDEGQFIRPAQCIRGMQPSVVAKHGIGERRLLIEEIADAREQTQALAVTPPDSVLEFVTAPHVDLVDRGNRIGERQRISGAIR